VTEIHYHFKKRNFSGTASHRTPREKTGERLRKGRSDRDRGEAGERRKFVTGRFITVPTLGEKKKPRTRQLEGGRKDRCGKILRGGANKILKKFSSVLV